MIFWITVALNVLWRNELKPRLQRKPSAINYIYIYMSRLLSCKKTKTEKYYYRFSNHHVGPTYSVPRLRKLMTVTVYNIKSRISQLRARCSWPTLILTDSGRVSRNS